MLKLIAVSSSLACHMWMNARMAAFTDRMRVGALNDKAGLKSGKRLIKRAIEVATAMRGEK